MDQRPPDISRTDGRDVDPYHCRSVPCFSGWASGDMGGRSAWAERPRLHCNQTSAMDTRAGIRGFRIRDNLLLCPGRQRATLVLDHARLGCRSRTVGNSLGALRGYIHFFNSYSKTYGSLGAVIMLMLWFYVTGLAFLIGGEINATIEHAAAERGHPEAKPEGKKAA
jgi:virulence factor BrkB